MLAGLQVHFFRKIIKDHNNSIKSVNYSDGTQICYEKSIRESAAFYNAKMIECVNAKMV